MRNYYDLPKAGWVKRQLWKCAGGDRFLLERATYSDQIKYMCLGGIVFATGGMAGLAGGYAFYTIFGERGNAIDDSLDTNAAIMAVFFGIIWGLIIYNIDRFIVTSTGKGDGTEAITMSELKTALPRIIMGTIIALTISKPVEIRMFQTEINIKLHEKQIEQKQIYINKIDSTFNTDINNRKKDILAFTTRISQLEKICDTLKNRIDFQIANGGCKGKCEEYKRQLANNQLEIKKIENKPDYLKVRANLESLEIDRVAKIAEGDKIAQNLDGLLERIKIAHEVAGFWISLFITLLFLAIELTPIFFKLMLTKTTYDYLAENRDELIKAENGIEVQYDHYTSKAGTERHLVINHQANKLIFEKIKVSEIQKELTEYAVEKYKHREKEKIDANLDQYIKSIDESDATTA